MIRTRRIKDKHGLHSHWQIELVYDEQISFKIGYGLIGAIYKKSCDKLSREVASMMGIPVNHS